MATPFAFVSLLTSDSYLPGALAVAAALKDLHPVPPVQPEVEFQTVCLVTPETVDVSSIKLLRRAFDVVVGVELIEQEDNVKGLQLLGRPDLTHVLTKLHAFRLTQYSKLIFLDADVLPIRPISHLFTIPHEFAAVPDVGWPDIFNSGVLVFSPGEDKFNELMGLLRTKGSWDGGDQGLLNEWRGGDWHRLSFTYNTTPSAAYTYAPAYERFGSKISAIHFIGSSKPWSSIPYRAPGSVGAEKPPLGASEQQRNAYDYASLIDRWYDVYDRHYRTDQPMAHADFEVRRYTSAWDTEQEFGELPTMTSPIAPVAGATLGLEDLRKIAVEGMSRVGSTAEVSEQGPHEGEYRSLPLEGRVDLMRPRHEPEPQQDQHETQEQMEQGGDITPKQEEYKPSSGGPDQGQRTEQPPHHLYPPQLQRPLPAEQPYRQPEWHVGEQQYRPAHVPGHAEHHVHVHPRVDDYRRDDSHSRSPPPEGITHHGHHRPARHYHGQPEHAPTSPPGPLPSLPPSQPPAPSQPQAFHQPEPCPPPTQTQPPQPYQRPEPPRPPSPSKFSWNPAVEPPPNTAPGPSSFPVDTYFPNVWDQIPSQQHDATHQLFPPPPQSPAGPGLHTFFNPPPPAVIPEQLVQQGQYAGVIGQTHETPPTPDRSKVHAVFPWEEKPRHVPRRVFPVTDSPPPSTQYIEAELSPPTAHLGSPAPGRPILHVQTPPSAGLPSNLSYSNAWDTVPSIQRYASRLVRPPYRGIVASPSAPSDDGWRKWEKERERVVQAKQDASSMDGDDEDEGDDEESDKELTGRREQDGGRERSGSGSRSRAPSSASALSISKGKKYRTCGVQTTAVEMRNQSVQVSILTDDMVPKKASEVKPRGGGVSGVARREVAYSSVGTGGGLLPAATFREFKADPDQMGAATPLATHALRSTMPFPTTGSPPASRSPQTLGSPRNYSPPKLVTPPKVLSPPKSPSPPKVPSPKVVSPRRLSSAQPVVSSPRKSSVSSKTSSPIVGPVTPPQSTPSPKLARLASPFAPPLARTSSNDTTITSSPSTQGPIITPESTPIMGSVRKGGRVWDPARGVDVFKRGSEEVLARFLRMGSFDEEERRVVQ
ncbi:hypothetical protein BKA93DRAFT_810095 [Sparassis latifolia]